MLDDSLKIKQVELNTIASSFGGLSSQVTKLHKYILCELDNDDKVKHVSILNKTFSFFFYSTIKNFFYKASR